MPGRQDGMAHESRFHSSIPAAQPVNSTESNLNLSRAVMPQQKMFQEFL